MGKGYLSTHELWAGMANSVPPSPASRHYTVRYRLAGWEATVTQRSWVAVPPVPCFRPCKLSLIQEVANDDCQNNDPVVNIFGSETEQELASVFRTCLNVENKGCSWRRVQRSWRRNKWWSPSTTWWTTPRFRRLVAGPTPRRTGFDRRPIVYILIVLRWNNPKSKEFYHISSRTRHIVTGLCRR